MPLGRGGVPLAAMAAVSHKLSRAPPCCQVQHTPPPDRFSLSRDLALNSAPGAQLIDLQGLFCQTVGHFGRAVSGGRGRAGAVWESCPRDLPAIVAPGICPRSRGALRSWPLDTAAGMAKEDNECNVVPERIDRPLSAAFDNGEDSG